MTVAESAPPPYAPPGMITGQQIRAGRAMLGWSAVDLAEKSGVHVATISKAEQADGIPNVRATTLGAIQSAMESGGLMFLSHGDTRDGGPGVRMRG